MARYFEFKAETDYCGTTSYYYEKFDNNDVDEETLYEYCEQYALQNAENYDYLVLGWDNTPEDLGMSEEDYQNELDYFYENATCSYKEISEKEWEKIHKKY